jgi:hypothetical protein
VNNPDPFDRDSDAGRDYAAASAVLAEITATTFEVLAQWPLPPTHPAVKRLGLLVDRHGTFTILSVALGWCSTEIRDRLHLDPHEPLPAGAVRVRYPARPQGVEVEGVVAKLLEHVLAGVDGVPRLYDAAAMLRVDPVETSRVLVGVLDLCGALRLHTAELVTAGGPL